MATEPVTGTRSMFGQQVLSGKPTKERTKFGTSGRTDKLVGYEGLHLGGVSQGVTTDAVPAFGHQPASRCKTAPSIRFGNRYASDHEMGKEARPGPGTYEATEAVGKQPLSPNPNMPAWKTGTGPRFSTYKNVWKEDFQTPTGAYNWKPEKGWLGDAPKYSFHGAAKRADISRGLPGQKPTNTEDPGPGMYEAPSSIGPQHTSNKQSAPRVRVGTSDRDAIARKQYISAEHERSLYGKHSPAPNQYNPTQSLSKTSPIPSPQQFRFGSGDRFSQVKPRDNRRKLPGLNTPGPGTYVV